MEKRKLNLQYCPVCKDELVNTDDLTICDSCIFSVEFREDGKK
jgi:hypothetical protein